MTERLFKKLHVSPSGLSDDIGLGRAVLPDIQRPSVWASAKSWSSWLLIVWAIRTQLRFRHDPA